MAVLEYLIDEGIFPPTFIRMEESDPDTAIPPLTLAAMSDDNTDSARFLISKGAPLEISYRGKTAFQHAIDAKMNKMAKLLMDAGCIVVRSALDNFLCNSRPFNNSIIYF